MRLPLSRNLFRLFRRQVTLGAGRIGIDRQPDNALARILILQLLHVTPAVMLLYERALRIKPLQHDILTLVLRQRVRLAFRVGDRKIRRSASYLGRIEGKDCGGDQ